MGKRNVVTIMFWQVCYFARNPKNTLRGIAAALRQVSELHASCSDSDICFVAP